MGSSPPGCNNMAAQHTNLLTTVGVTTVGATSGQNGPGGASAGGGVPSVEGGGIPAAVSLARYQNHQNYSSVHSSQNGPRSLSDSSQAESPVQDDLLTSSNTPNSATNNSAKCRERQCSRCVLVPLSNPAAQSPPAATASVWPESNSQHWPQSSSHATSPGHASIQSRRIDLWGREWRRRWKWRRRRIRWRWWQ